MSLTLTSSQKASIELGLDDGNGNVTPLGGDFHFQFNPNDFARIENHGGTFFVVAQAEGVSSLHLTTLDGTVSTDVTITVSDEPGGGGEPSLVVTFGAPEPK